MNMTVPKYTTTFTSYGSVSLFPPAPGLTQVQDCLGHQKVDFKWRRTVRSFFSSSPERFFLAGLVLLLALPLLWGEFHPHQPLLSPVPAVRAGLSVCPGGTEGLKALPAAGELGLLELGLCHIRELGVCPPNLLQGTGQRVQVPVVLVSRLPQVQDDGGGAALGGEEGEIPAGKKGEKKQG